MSLEVITDAAVFDKHVSGDKLVVVDFHATWCGPCKMVAPQIAALAAEHGDAVIFLKVDVDEMEELAQTYKVTAMPTFVFLKGGKEVHRVMGADKAKVEQGVIAHK